ncbi:MAG: hypothetical protein KDK38_05330 [Leptospiraceae bacterium]|nr:hypothetical protein [Leptospiraceae bacterium]
MIYLLAILIAAMAMLFLSSLWIRGHSYGFQERKVSEDEAIETAKAALRDLQLEYSIGKITKEDYEAARADIATEVAQSQSKANKLGLMIILFLGSFLTVPVDAYDIAVKFTNGTYNNSPAKVESVELIKLEGSMQPIKKINNPGTSFTFQNVEAPSNGPYMVQVDYRGVTYSKVIPPNTASGTLNELEVFETVQNYSSANIDFRTVQELHYIEGDKLKILHIFFFRNNSKLTYLNPAKGVEVFIPEGASEIAASVSVGSGSSNIQWLKLAAQDVADKKNYKLLKYPIKPGERIFQLQYSLGYTPKGKALRYELPFEPDIPAQVVVQPGDITVKDKNGNDFPAETNAEIGQKIYAVDTTNKSYEFVLSGGTPMPDTREQTADNESVDVVVKSPLSDLEKIILASLVFLVALGTKVGLDRRPAWLRRAQVKELAKMKAELELLNKMQNVEERIQPLQARIQSLERWLDLEPEIK